MPTEFLYGGVKVVIDDDQRSSMKYWDGKIDYYFHEREAWNPMPPANMLDRALSWLSHRQSRSASQAQIAMCTLPEWPRQQSASERLARMHKSFVQPAEAFDPDITGNVLFAGPTGVGKTLAMVHSVLSLWERRIARVHERKPLPAVLFLKHAAIANARRNSPLGEEPQIIQDAMKAELLLIDDVGLADDRDSALVEIVDHRYDRGRPTLATTGLQTAEFSARLGEMLLRRLLQTVRPGKLVSAFPKAALAAVARGAR
jgi:DNA replication protein DnaC